MTKTPSIANLFHIFLFFLSILTTRISYADNKILCAPTGYDSYISKEFNEIQLELEALGWEQLLLNGENDQEAIRKLEHADAILFFETYDFIKHNHKQLSSNEKIKKAKKYFFCDDVHYFTSNFRKKRLQSYLFTDVIFATYPHALLNHFPEIQHDKVKWSPHAAASYFKPTFNPTQATILLSGSRSWPYPFREFCARRLPTSVCTTIEHPGYPRYPGNNTIITNTDTTLMEAHGQERYADLLRKYPAMLVGGSIFNYLVAKVFEGMASGCLVICDRASIAPHLTQLGFIEGEDFLSTDIFHVIDDSQSFINMFSDNKIQWAKIVKRAHKKVSKNHTTMARARQIDTFVKNDSQELTRAKRPKTDYIGQISSTY